MKMGDDTLLFNYYVLSIREEEKSKGVDGPLNYIFIENVEIM